MTPREQSAHDLGLRTALNMARIVAITMETAPGATDIRKRAAIAALYAFVEAAGVLELTAKPNAGPIAFEMIASLPGTSGEIPCPGCSARFRWIRDSTNGHIHGQCEAGCLTVLQ